MKLVQVAEVPDPEQFSGHPGEAGPECQV